MENKTTSASKSKFFRVRLTSVSEAFEDIFTTLAFEHGANGVSEALHYSQPNLAYDPHILPTQNHEMDIFFETTPSDDFFKTITEMAPQVKWKIFEEEQKDWLEEWKKGYEPFKLVGPHWVIPSWITPPENCKSPLFIDPGMAFGTGTHATTKIAAYLVHKLGQDIFAPTTTERKVLDVGTGTAILAMLASRIGFQSVVGLEIDPEARRTARENIKLNNFTNIEISDTPIEEFRGSFDLVVANIIDGVLIQLKRELMRLAKDSGYLILTGILRERDEFFFEKFIEDTNLKVVRRLEDQEWVGYLVQKI